jgi:hypothetical protein
VRIFIAPSIEEIKNTPVSAMFAWNSFRQLTIVHFVSQLKPYVAMDVRLTKGQKKEVFGKLPQGGLTGEHYYDQQLWKREVPSRAVSSEETK